MTFETVRGDDGQYEDIFDYVFYDDPAVHGDLRLARRMFEVTVDGTEYLMFEQKLTGYFPMEVPYRFPVYKRVK